MLSWIGTITSILGSFLVALGFILMGYSAFLVGSTSWLIVAFTKRDQPLALLNTAFLTANIIGLARAF